MIELPEKLRTSRPYKCIRVSKFYIALNEGMNFPDGFTVLESVSDEPSWRDWNGDSWVELKFHRIEDVGTGPAGHLARAMSVASGAVDRGDISSPESELDIGTYSTVV